MAAYRLANARVYDLAWYLNEGSAAVSGLKAQSYAQHVDGGRNPLDLLLQERQVERALASENGIVRARRIEAVRAKMATEPGGRTHWGYLALAYGPLRVQDPHNILERELAPIARYTPLAREQAASDWPAWWCAREERRYLASLSDIRAEGSEWPGTANVEVVRRAISWVQTEPLEWEIETLAGEYVGKIGRGSPMVQVLRAQADAMFSEACRACTTAWDAFEREARANSRRERTKSVQAARSQVEALENLLANWPGR